MSVPRHKSAQLTCIRQIPPERCQTVRVVPTQSPAAFCSLVHPHRILCIAGLCRPYKCTRLLYPTACQLATCSTVLIEGAYSLLSAQIKGHTPFMHMNVWVPCTGKPLGSPGLQIDSTDTCIDLVRGLLHQPDCTVQIAWGCRSACWLLSQLLSGPDELKLHVHMKAIMSGMVMDDII